MNFESPIENLFALQRFSDIIRIDSIKDFNNKTKYKCVDFVFKEFHFRFLLMTRLYQKIGVR